MISFLSIFLCVSFHKLDILTGHVQYLSHTGHLKQARKFLQQLQVYWNLLLLARIEV